MLTSSKQCLEQVGHGTLDTAALAALRALVQRVSATATAADKHEGGNVVDDELADMDRAIEDAAGQIEVRIEISHCQKQINFFLDFLIVGFKFVALGCHISVLGY